MLLTPCPSIIRRNASTLVGSHGFFRVQRSVHGFVGLLALCSTAAFSLLSNGMLAVALAHYSSASAPDSHRLPLFSPLITGHKTDMQFSGKRKSHTGRPSAGVTDCSHFLPSFTPSQGCAPGSHMVGILALRISEAKAFFVCIQPSQVSPMTGSLQGYRHLRLQLRV